MNLLIVTANRSEINKHLSQLKLLNFDVTIAESVEQAMKVVGAKNFGAVMLSWSLEDDVKNTFKHMSEERKLPCLIFTEERTRKATNSLLTSGIRNVIYPPLSAHGIHRRIQLLMRTQQAGLGMKKLPTVRPEAAPAEARKQRRKSLETIVETVLKGLPANFAFAGAKEGTASCVVMAEIQWPESQGYLVAAVDKQFREKAFLEGILKEVVKQLEAGGDGQGSSGRLHEVELGFKTIKKWASTRAECIVSSKFASSEVMVAYADTDTLPGIAPTPNPEFYWVDVNRWLSAKAKLPFDVYVHLPENNKYVLYIRKDSAVSEQNISRLSKIGSDRCFIKINEGGQLFKHLFSNPAIHPSANIASGW